MLLRSHPAAARGTLPVGRAGGTSITPLLDSISDFRAPGGDVTASEIADRRAVARAQAGHREAFEEVVRRHESGLLSLCSRLLRDGRLGEDLTQETFVRAYSRLGSFRGQSSFRHWLYRIAANGCRDFLKSGRRSERPSDMSGDELWTLRDPERDAVARQSLEALSDAVAGLPPACRSAFILFYLENLSYEEISAATGVGVNALKVRVHRARELLRRRLSGLVEPHGAVVR
jgi:RNA polymerase sigma-70 factor (ECF subfamily)